VSSNSGGATAPKFYDVQEVAVMFKMSRMTVYRAIGSGELHAIRIRGRWLVPARVIDALVEGALLRAAAAHVEVPGGPA
jgi:excisionase family DNA binding protein